MHDYIQLVFGQETISIYNRLEVCIEGKRFQSGQAGFADALIRLIGSTAESVHEDDESILRLWFEGGSSVGILKAEEGSMAIEAFQFTTKNGVVVGQNIPSSDK